MVTRGRLFSTRGLSAWEKARFRTRTTGEILTESHLQKVVKEKTRGSSRTDLEGTWAIVEWADRLRYPGRTTVHIAASSEQWSTLELKPNAMELLRRSDPEY